MKKYYAFVALMFVFLTIGQSQVQTTSFEFQAASLYVDPAFQTHIRTVYVHTIEQFEAGREYPVVIFLPGWPGFPDSYGFFADILKKLLGEGKIDPMIIFIPSGIGGLYTTTNYWDSSTNGGYGSFITKDLIKYINSNYPVIKAADGTHDRNSWILSGWSMGGGGAGRLAYKYPKLFSGLASFSGDLSVEAYQEIIEFAKMENDNNCKIIYPLYGYPPEEELYWTHSLWEAASVFSPGPAPAYAVFPLDENCSTIESVWNRWKFAHADYLAETYYNIDGNDKASMDVFLQVGKKEMIGPEGRELNMYSFTKPFYDVLVNNNVPVNYVLHDKGHWFDEEQAEELLLWADAHFKKSPTRVESNKVNPKLFSIMQNYPNPFNSTTTLTYQLSQANHVTLAIFNAVGQKVVTLVDERQESGTHTLVWDGRDQNGQAAASGLYLYSLKAGDFVQHKKMVILK